VAVAPASARPSPSWQFRPTATANTLIVVDVVDPAVVWAAGGAFAGAKNDGTVVRTVDGGRTWRDVTPPGGSALVFRDVEAFDRNHAVVLTTPNGADPGRIYRTTDGGMTWNLAFQNPDPAAFYDCMAFFDRRHGLAVSDAVNGKFPILETVDSGRSWHLTSTGGMPAALAGEGALASGTCLVTVGARDAWFGTTVDGHNARVFHTRNAGTTWTVADTPIPGTPIGIVSLSFRDRLDGLAVGGDSSAPVDVAVAARTSDGGRTWRLVGSPAGFRNSVAWVPGVPNGAVAVGISGSDLSTDAGRTWTRFDRSLLLGVNCIRNAVCWAVGGHGLAAKLRL
jgi:photosystem II stability/assembly factor-like uncharacterized protein